MTITQMFNDAVSTVVHNSGKTPSLLMVAPDLRADYAAEQGPVEGCDPTGEVYFGGIRVVASPMVPYGFVLSAVKNDAVAEAAELAKAADANLDETLPIEALLPPEIVNSPFLTPEYRDELKKQYAAATDCGCDCDACADFDEDDEESETELTPLEVIEGAISDTGLTGETLMHVEAGLRAIREVFDYKAGETRKYCTRKDADEVAKLLYAISGIKVPAELQRLYSLKIEKRDLVENLREVEAELVDAKKEARTLRAAA